MQASFVVFDLTITLIARDFPDSRARHPRKKQMGCHGLARFLAPSSIMGRNWLGTVTNLQLCTAYVC
jgi:hypothetical protein